MVPTYLGANIMPNTPPNAGPHSYSPSTQNAQGAQGEALTFIAERVAGIELQFAHAAIELRHHERTFSKEGFSIEDATHARRSFSTRESARRARKETLAHGEGSVGSFWAERAWKPAAAAGFERLKGAEIRA